MTHSTLRALRNFAALPIFFAAVFSAQAQDWAKARLDASPRHHGYVKLTHGSRTVDAFVVYPEVKTKVKTPPAKVIQPK